MLDALQNMLDAMPPRLRDPAMFILGIGLLLAGGKTLVDGAIILAKRCNVSLLFIGLTVVAFGTSLPEFSFNIASALRGTTDLAFGNIIGSNIANIGLVLGLTILLGPIVVSSRLIEREIPWLVCVSGLLVALAWLPPHTPDPIAPKLGFARFDGVIMLLLLLYFVVTWYRLATCDSADPLVAEVAAVAGPKQTTSLFAAGAFIVAGIALLALGATVTESGAAGLARLFGVSDELIGLTIVAVCTSLPELITTLMAAARKQADLALGNVVGSNIFNLLLIFAVTAIIAPVAVPRGVGWYDLAFALVLTIFLWPICLSKTRTIGRIEGAALFGSYMAYMYWRAVNELQ